MKKFIPILLAIFLLCTALTACGNETVETEKTTETVTVAETEPETKAETGTKAETETETALARECYVLHLTPGADGKLSRRIEFFSSLESAVATYPDGADIFLLTVPCDPVTAFAHLQSSGYVLHVPAGRNINLHNYLPDGIVCKTTDTEGGETVYFSDAALLEDYCMGEYASAHTPLDKGYLWFYEDTEEHLAGKYLIRVNKDGIALRRLSSDTGESDGVYRVSYGDYTYPTLAEFAASAEENGFGGNANVLCDIKEDEPIVLNPLLGIKIAFSYHRVDATFAQGFIYDDVNPNDDGISGRCYYSVLNPLFTLYTDLAGTVVWICSDAECDVGMFDTIRFLPGRYRFYANNGTTENVYGEDGLCTTYSYRYYTIVWEAPMSEYVP